MAAQLNPFAPALLLLELEGCFARQLQRATGPSTRLIDYGGVLVRTLRFSVYVAISDLQSITRRPPPFSLFEVRENRGGDRPGRSQETSKPTNMQKTMH